MRTAARGGLGDQVTPLWRRERREHGTGPGGEGLLRPRGAGHWLWGSSLEVGLREYMHSVLPKGGMSSVRVPPEAG